MITRIGSDILRRASGGFVLIILFILAFGLRVGGLGTVPVRGDEAYALLNWTNNPFSPSWVAVLSREPHPAGALLLFSGWTGLMGISEVAARLLPTLSNLIGMSIVTRLALDMTASRRAALFTAAVWALNPFLVYHAQDARTLATLSALSALNVLLLRRALTARTPHSAVAYVMSQTVTFYLSYVEAFSFAAQIALVLTGVLAHTDKKKSSSIRFAITRLWLPVTVLCIPVGLMLLNFLLNSRFETHSTGFDLSVLLTSYLPSLLFGSTPSLLTLPFMTIIGLYFFLYGRPIGRPTATALIWATVPILVFTLAARVSSGFFLPGYLIGVVAPLSLLLGMLTLRRGGVILTSAALILMGVGLARYWTIDPPKSPDWRSLAASLTLRQSADSIFVLGTPDTAAEYYLRLPLYFMPPGDADPESDFARLLTDNDTVFVSGDARAESARLYYLANAQRIDDGQPLGVMQFRPWDVPPSEITHPITLDFGDVARLRGWSLSGAGQPGTVLSLYWQAGTPTANAHSILTHLTPGILDDSTPAIVLDHGIRHSEITSTSWSTGGLYRDDLRLPDDLAPGWYTVWTGLYDVVTGDAAPPTPRLALGVFYHP